MELPFTLTHPKPVESPSMSQSMLHEDMIPVDTNLIKLDTKYVYKILKMKSFFLMNTFYNNPSCSDQNSHECELRLSVTTKNTPTQ